MRRNGSSNRRRASTPAALTITQHEAVSDDGTRIPYFQIGRAELRHDGSNAVLLTGYGGFQISSLPYYAATNGKLWLERGGVSSSPISAAAASSARTGTRPACARARSLRMTISPRCAKDLIARGVTRPARLACAGGSNGGLLVGNMLTRYPELFGAIECAVPLLDMKRYTKLTAGPSWIAEYGDPDVAADWAFLKDISAYQAVQPGRPYPPILLTTSGRDDRVHPGHARKMASEASWRSAIASISTNRRRRPCRRDRQHPIRLQHRAPLRVSAQDHRAGDDAGLNLSRRSAIAAPIEE